ncbi:MAG TPA: hypothetical protein VMM77_03545 [Gemmatimonadaceae bacterium]|nr:hypothetical protein [Gemmatimonadaceae bacterium]
MSEIRATIFFTPVRTSDTSSAASRPRPWPALGELRHTRQRGGGEGHTVVAPLVLLLLVLSAPYAVAGPVAHVEVSVVERVNEIRQTRGLEPLRVDTALMG